MEKIQMTTPLVEMDGDEMTRVLWQQIKDELLLPYIDLKTEYYDLGLPERERTKDQVTVDSAEATKKYGAEVVLVPGVYSDFTKDEMLVFADLVRPYVDQVSLRGIDY